MKRMMPLLVAAALLAGCGGVSGSGDKPANDAAQRAKLDGAWVGSGAAEGVKVVIRGAGGDKPEMMYGFRDEPPRPVACSASGVTLSCVHESRLTTTYTLAADGTVAFTAKGPNPGDSTISATLQRKH